MCKKSLLLHLALLTSTLVTLTAVSVEAAPPAREISTVAVFTYQVGDRILSDGLSYVDGSDNAQCSINPSGGDFRLSIGNRSRYLSADLSQQFPATYCPLNPEVTPWPQIVTDVHFLNVNSLLSVPVNSDWYTTGAVFGSKSIGPFLRLAGPRYSDPYCSTPVQIQHPDSRTWNIRAVPGISGPPDNDVALLGRDGSGPVRYLHLPFHLTVTLR
jgi:hypothetical protein